MNLYLWKQHPLIQAVYSAAMPYDLNLYMNMEYLFEYLLFPSNQLHVKII
jgi:hypothetical protein